MHTVKSTVELFAGPGGPSPSVLGTAVLASSDLLFRTRVRDSLVGMRWRVREANGGAEALACFRAAPSEVLILDSWLPDLELEEFVEEFRRLYPEVDVFVADQGAGMTSTIRSPRRNEVLHALHQGQDGVRVDVHGRWGGSAVLDETDAGSRPATGTVPVPGTVPESARLSQPSELLGKHPVMLEVIRSIRLVAPHHKPVLIEGPTGTGKELVARAIHRLSARSEKPFVALNCAAIPEPLFEAELFGHTRGAFTGAIQRRTGHIEAAKGGTLLLDEIGEMPPSMQAKLLRFVESGELQRLGESRPDRVDVRIVAATNCSLERLMREGAFRTDLYYRLAVFLIRTPSLSEHKEDIPVLVSHFLKKFGGAGITDSAMEKILSHSWPGNVRELENVIDRALVFASSLPKIGAGHGVLVGASDIQYAESPLEH